MNLGTQLNIVSKLINILIKSIKIVGISLNFNMRFLLNKLKKQKIIIIEIDYSGLIQYVEPVVNELLNRKLGICLYISYGNVNVINDLSHINIPRTHFFSSEYIKYLFFQDAFISPTQWANCPKFGLKICMFHGQPSKNTTFIPELIKKFNFLFFISPLQKEFFEMRLLKKSDQFDNIITFDIGYPKSDDFFNGKYDKKTVLSLLGLNHYKTTVIYAPSYEEGTSLREFGEEVISNLVEMDINLLVKLHPASLSPEGDVAGTQCINWNEKLKKFKRFPNYRFLNTKLIDPYLIASDIMVTDVSGVAFEFMNLDRPIIYFESPNFYEKYLVERLGIDANSAREDIFCNVGRDAGLLVSSPKELPDAIIKSINNPKEFSEKRKKIIEKLTFNKGHASEIFIEKLLDLLNH